MPGGIGIGLFVAGPANVLVDPAGQDHPAQSVRMSRGQPVEPEIDQRIAARLFELRRQHDPVLRQHRIDRAAVRPFQRGKPVKGEPVQPLGTRLGQAGLGLLDQ